MRNLVRALLGKRQEPTREEKGGNEEKKDPIVSGPSRDLYEILQVHESAHADVVQAAYRRLSLLYHPDRNNSAEAPELMRELNRAYEVLSDPQRRDEYDRSRNDLVPSLSDSGIIPVDAEWGIDEIVDPLSREREVYVSTMDRDNSGILLVRIKHGQFGIQVGFPDELTLDEDIVVEFRIGDSDIQSGVWDVTTTGKSLFAPAERAADIVEQLLRSPEFVLQTLPEYGSVMTVSFDLNGFPAAYQRLLRAYEGG